MTDINYLELPAPALARTKSFYASAFGWEFVDYGPSYSASISGSVEIGLNAEGLAADRHRPGAENAVGPLALFQSESLPVTQALVEGAGGEIISPPYDYPGGTRFHFVDPSGNVLGVYQSADPT